MFNKISHFIQYNNAIPIFLGVVFLGSGMAFAASSEMRDTVISSQQELRSFDNGRIVNVDLETYATGIEITNVTEDELFYFVVYNLHTIDLVDGVWQDVSKEQLLRVAKDAIAGKDLGTYATKELAQVRDSELIRLKATQEIERAIGLSSKTVATVYSGLIGKFLDEKSEVIPGYVPVVAERPLAPYPGTEADTATNESAPGNVASSGGSNANTSGNTTTVVGDASDTEPPVITILGNNPAYLALRTQYSDLGAYVYDNKHGDLGYKVFVDDVEVQYVQISTATTTTYTITYKAVDQVGNTAQAVRLVHVYDPAVTTPPTSSQQPTANSSQQTTTTGSGGGTTGNEQPAATTTTDTEQPTATTTDNQQPAAGDSQQTATTTDSQQETADSPQQTTTESEQQTPSETASSTSSASSGATTTPAE